MLSTQKFDNVATCVSSWFLLEQVHQGRHWLDLLLEACSYFPVSHTFGLNCSARGPRGYIVLRILRESLYEEDREAAPGGPDNDPPEAPTPGAMSCAATVLHN
jgi:hypothetical protein